MTSKSSDEMKAEITNLYDGVDPKTQATQRVTLSRGGILTLTEAGKLDRSYRIRNGRPALAEIARAFGLTNLVAQDVRPATVRMLGQTDG